MQWAALSGNIEILLLCIQSHSDVNHVSMIHEGFANILFYLIALNCHCPVNQQFYTSKTNRTYNTWPNSSVVLCKKFSRCFTSLDTGCYKIIVNVARNSPDQMRKTKKRPNSGQVGVNGLALDGMDCPKKQLAESHQIFASFLFASECHAKQRKTRVKMKIDRTRCRTVTDT